MLSSTTIRGVSHHATLDPDLRTAGWQLMALCLGRLHSDHLFLRRAGRLADERPYRRFNHRCSRRRHRHRRLSNAGFDGAGCDGLRFPIRFVADLLDHRGRRVSLQAHGQNRPVRDYPFLGLVHYRRPAPANGSGRLLLRRLSGRSGGIRCAGGDHRRAVGRSWLQPALCRWPVSDRQHRTGSVWRPGHSYHGRRQSHRHRSIPHRSDGGPATAAVVAVRSVLAGVHHGRLARRAGNLAGDFRRSGRVCSNAILHLQPLGLRTAGYYVRPGQFGRSHLIFALHVAAPRKSRLPGCGGWNQRRRTSLAVPI